MKVLLALSLLFFFDSVFSQGDLFTCPIFNRCPVGYTPIFSGRNMLNAVCQCKKDPEDTSICEHSAKACISSWDLDCSRMESNCSPTEIINVCNKNTYLFPEVCDRANQRLRIENYAKSQPTCEFNKNQCNSGVIYRCMNAADTCDPDTTIQLCKNKRIPYEAICEAAEIRKEIERVEDAKYSCDYGQWLCLNNHLEYCSDIPKFCDVETAFKWCFKNDIKQIDKISDENCSIVVKKYQYLMFGKSYGECWNQVPLCEGGNSEACTQVATLCVKEVVSALCNAKKITNRRICTYAGLENTTSSSYPGCKFFADKCRKLEDGYCQLASRYCDNGTINDLCKSFSIIDESVCKRVQGGNNGYFLIPIPIPVIGGTIQVPNILGF